MADVFLPILMRRKRIRKTLRTGMIASVMAVMILRRAWNRPNSLITRRDRRTRTKPVGSLVTERSDMPTMKQSSQDLRHSTHAASKEAIESTVGLAMCPLLLLCTLILNNFNLTQRVSRMLDIVSGY